MKVLLLSGSPHQGGCTETALQIVAEQLHQAGVETELFRIGAGPVRGCIDCGHCKAGLGRCVFSDDPVNQAAVKLPQIDGLVLGSPVHYASIAGVMSAFLDRFVRIGKEHLAYKPCACLVTARRSGTTAALDQLMKYPTNACMPVVSSVYWNMVHGNTPEEMQEDLEGLHIMRMLGRNMAWMLQCIEAAKAAGVKHPVPEGKIYTNFIH